MPATGAVFSADQPGWGPGQGEACYRLVSRPGHAPPEVLAAGRSRELALPAAGDSCVLVVEGCFLRFAGCGCVRAPRRCVRVCAGVEAEHTGGREHAFGSSGGGGPKPCLVAHPRTPLSAAAGSAFASTNPGGSRWWTFYGFYLLLFLRSIDNSRRRRSWPPWICSSYFWR